MNITSVVAPAYLIRAELLTPRQELPPLSFSTAFPFGLLCKVSDLEMCVGELMVPATDHQTRLSSRHHLPAAAELYGDGDLDAEHPCPGDALHDEHELLSSDLNYDPQLEESVDNAERDAAAEAQAQALTATLLQSINNPVVRARVLGDIWHLMDQFKISVHHGLHCPFLRALCDALFLPDPEDKAAVEHVLEKCKTTFKQMVLSKPDWVWQRVKCYVPPPEILVARAHIVLQTYGPLKDATTGLPLFNDASWDKARCVMENIQMGFYSDPPSINLYTIQWQDKDGLFVY